MGADVEALLDDNVFRKDCVRRFLAERQDG